MQTHELLNVSFQVQQPDLDIKQLGESTGANMPWAEDHFRERVCGEPLNPGEEWKNWPWGNKADTFRDKNGQFNHNYMERYWPKLARQTPGGKLPDRYMRGHKVRRGIAYEYGDLADVVLHLMRDPLSRQAFLPVWFPEDTGVVHGGRVPCSLGYHFILRENKLHIVYYLRSCDFIRHFGDDCYLTARLQAWMVEHLGMPDLAVGTFTMHITSLHVFRNDFIQMEAGKL